METLSANHHNVFNITQAYIGYLYLFLENFVIFMKIIVISSILHAYIDHWILYIQILYYFKCLHIFLRKKHSLDTRKTRQHNQFKFQLIDTIAIHMSVNVSIKSQRISNIHKNIVTYLIKLLHTGECYRKLYSTDKNYRIIGIIVHNQKNDIHNVHACLDSKNSFTNYVLVFIYRLLFMILIIRPFISIIDRIQNLSTMHLLTFINCTIITILFHDYKYSGAAENRYHFSHLTSTIR